MTRDLSRLFRPKSIAVLGGVWAENVIAQCIKMGFKGDIWPVHPKRDFIGGIACFRTMADLPAPPDAAFLGVNRQAAVALIGELSAMGAGGAICFAAGFAETGDDDLQVKLVQAAGDMPVLGPNCYGIINYLDGALLWPDQHGGRRVEKGVALISQSSNIAVNLTMQRRGLPIAYVACVGNAAQTGTAEIALAMLADPRVTAIGMYLEGIGDARDFLAMAREAQRLGKPLVALKSGKSEGARSAAATHTAALAGSGVASSAFLKRAGVVEVNDIPEMVETLKFLHVHGPLQGNRVVSMSCSGGEAGLMADLAAGLPLQWPQPAAQQATALAALLGPLVSISNPFDYHTFIWGDVARMTATYATMMQGGYDAAILVLDFPHADRCSDAAWEPAVQALIAAHKQTGIKAIMAASLPENLPESRADALLKAGIVPIGGLQVALNVVANAASKPRIDANWQTLPIRPTQGARLLDEAQSKALLAKAGIRVPNGTIGTADTITRKALPLVAPLALKGLGFAHKSESGAVKLNLYQTDIAAAAAIIPATTYLVEEMVQGCVAELLVGVRADPIYGATLTIGMGGVEAELLQDTATMVLPVSENDVRSAMQGLKLAPLLTGYRGKPKADADAAITAALAIANLYATDATITEIEVNPLMLRTEGKGAVAADAVIWRTQ